MIKYALYIALGYLVYRVLKNGAKLAIDSYQRKREITDTSVLRKCFQCSRFVSDEIALEYQDRPFCSQECINDFIERNQSINN